MTKPEVLHSLRAIEVLERIGTADARRILSSLSQGSPHARLTQEGKVALQRLAERGALQLTPETGPP